MRTISILLIGLLVTTCVSAQGRKKKKKGGKEEEEITQTLPPLKDPPAAVLAETQRLAFHVSPLSPRGLLSQQTRDALRSLFNQARGGAIVKLRAFVAGTGDMRRVQAIVSETFTDKKLPLPALSVIQVGALPLEGAQVVLEAAVVDKKILNPHGVAFFSGQQAPHIHESVVNLQTAVRAAGVTREAVLRATCFLSSLDVIQAARTTLQTAFPAAAANYVQLQRAALEPVAECEAVARLSAPPATPVEFLNPPGLTKSPNYSQIALVAAPKLVLSGTQMAFRDQEADVRLAFERLRKAIEPLGAGYKDVVMTHTYPLTRTIAEKVRGVRFDYFDKTRPPASTLLLFEGLPSLDATVAMEVIAALP